MAITQNTYTGNGSTVLYSFTFPYLETTDVKVTVNGTPTTAYTFANATTIQFNTAPVVGAAIRIYRDTDDASLAATFYSGSAIRAQDLNDNFTQNLYVAQEVNNNALDIDGSNTMVGDLNMGGNEILNIGPATVANSLVTKGYVDSYINTYYLGGASANPATRPGGSPLQNGDYYINLPSYQFRYYNGSQWIDVDYDTQQDRIAAETARTGAETARTGAETARTGAETARTGAETAKTGAETARTGAETARTGAELAKSGALIAQTAAEVARNDALLNSGVFATIALGLAATTDGQYFKVFSANTNDFLILYRNTSGSAVQISIYPSQAFFSFLLSDLSYDALYSVAWVDSNNRLAMSIKPTGVVRIENGDIGFPEANAASDPVYNHSYSVAWVDSTNRLAMGIKPTGQVRIESGDINFLDVNCTGDTTFSSFYPLVEVDSSLRISRAIKSNGTQYIPKLETTNATIDTLNVTTLVSGTPLGSVSAVHTSNSIFATEAVSGVSQIIKYNNGIRTQLTSVGSNSSPTVTSESPSRILFSSTRTGTQSYQVMSTDGSKLACAVPPKSLVMWGDSMTVGLSVGPWLANSISDGRAIRFRGVGGQSSVQIASRQGGLLATGTVVGGQIPASGAVGITGLYPSPVTSQGGDGLFSINGVIGTLNYNGGSVIFTRSTAGSIVNVTNPVTLIPVLDDDVDGTIYDLNEYTSVLWLGRNGVGGSFGETDVSVYTQVINNIRNLSKRILILSSFNGGYSLESNGDPAIPTLGTSGYDSIIARNNSVAAAFPQYWFDIRRSFIDGAESWLQTNYPTVYTSDWGQAFPSKQESNLGPNSSWDVANDVIPRALRGDNIHLNSYGNEFASQLIASKLHSLGW